KGVSVRLWVDAGVRDIGAIAPLQAAGIDTVVLGLETLAGPGRLVEILEAVGADHLVFSLDLRQKRPVAAFTAWRQINPLAIASDVIAVGIRRLLILDLARVGMGGGTGTEPLCRQLARSHAAIEISAGGGVRHVEDLRHLSQSGV